MARNNPRAGFSLLEVLATLALMALSLALVAPSFATAIARIDQRSAVSRLQLQMATQEYRARNEGVELRLAGLSDRGLGSVADRAEADPEPWQRLVLTPTPGWSVAAEGSVIVSPSAGCSGGPLVLRKDTGELVKLAVDEACHLSLAAR